MAFMPSSGYIQQNPMTAQFGSRYQPARNDELNARLGYPRIAAIFAVATMVTKEDEIEMGKKKLKREIDVSKGIDLGASTGITMKMVFTRSHRHQPKQQSETQLHSKVKVICEK